MVAAANGRYIIHDLLACILCAYGISVTSGNHNKCNLLHLHCDFVRSPIDDISYLHISVGEHTNTFSTNKSMHEVKKCI